MSSSRHSILSSLSQVTKPLTILQIDSLDDTAVAYQPGDPGKESPDATTLSGQLPGSVKTAPTLIVGSTAFIALAYAMTFCAYLRYTH